MVLSESGTILWRDSRTAVTYSLARDKGTPQQIGLRFWPNVCVIGNAAFSWAAWVVPVERLELVECQAAPNLGVVVAQSLRSAA